MSSGLTELQDGDSEADVNPAKRLRTAENEAQTPTGEEEERGAVDVVGDGTIICGHYNTENVSWKLLLSLQ